MLKFQLFRVKVLSPLQGSIFHIDKPSRTILEEIVNTKPSSELRTGHLWHLGNFKSLDQNAIYFAIGRTTKQTVELYDAKSGNFISENFESAPYTHVYLDYRIQVAAISAKYQLAPKISGIARQFQKLLTESEIAKINNIGFEVAALADPLHFIEYLRKSYAVKKYLVTFGMPNPFDTEKDFHRPMESLLKESQGTKGETTIKGDQLDVDVLEPLSRSAAANGNDAKATIQMTENRRQYVKKSLKSNFVFLNKSDSKTGDDDVVFLEDIREMYSKIRGPENV